MLKKLIKAQKKQLGTSFEAKCFALGLTLKDIEKAEQGIIGHGLELLLAELLMIRADEVIDFARHDRSQCAKRKDEGVCQDCL